jgi:predicted nucleotidyltransferase
MNAQKRTPLHDELAACVTVVPGIRLAIVYGSAASDRMRADSDIDIAVLKLTPLSADEKVAIIEAIAERTGRAVDLVDLATVGEPLLGQILKGGIVLTGDTTDYAELVRKHLFDAADFLPYVERMLAERRQSWIN